MNLNTLLRALLLAALFGVVVLIVTGFITRLGSRTGRAVRAAL